MPAAARGIGVSRTPAHVEHHRQAVFAACSPPRARGASRSHRTRARPNCAGVWLSKRSACSAFFFCVELVSLGGRAKKSFDKHLSFFDFFPLDFSGEVSPCISRKFEGVCTAPQKSARSSPRPANTIISVCGRARGLERNHSEESSAVLYSCSAAQKNAVLARPARVSSQWRRESGKQ